MTKRGANVRYFNLEVRKHTSMIAVPFFALFFWLIYYKSQYNDAEHFIANVLRVSFSNLAFTFLAFTLEAAKNTPWLPIVPSIGLVLQIIYYTYAYKDFMQQSGIVGTAMVFIQSFIAVVL
ncbi:hypothetical protein OQZ33_19340 [Pedobacter sp. MC2016-05]|uniref:hypothetical protein n=1 Tax=Pedobacter sp. MC2016-05 TaxID=2994474 RepID=UPI0022470EBE|nr:hypothetical protein [Pedobacter sp. MC2016-05]MCX2476498.1 hypothetical protein [Pedobacter sp. MC2016-05]